MVVAVLIVQAPAFAASSLSLARVTIDDAAGDGDGILEPGEEALLNLLVRNGGPDAISSAKASLTLQGVDVLDPEVTVADAAPGATTPASFRVRARDDVTTDDVFFNNAQGRCVLGFGRAFATQQALPAQPASVTEGKVAALEGTLRVGASELRVNAAAICVLGSRTIRGPLAQTGAPLWAFAAVALALIVLGGAIQRAVPRASRIH